MTTNILTHGLFFSLIAILVMVASGCGATGAVTGFDPTPASGSGRLASSTSSGMMPAYTSSYDGKTGEITPAQAAPVGFDVVQNGMPTWLSADKPWVNVRSASAIAFSLNARLSQGAPESLKLNVQVIPNEGNVGWESPDAATITRDRSYAYGRVFGLRASSKYRLAFTLVSSSGESFSLGEFEATTLDPIPDRVNRVGSASRNADFYWQQLEASLVNDRSGASRDSLQRPFSLLAQAMRAEKTIQATLSEGEDMRGQLSPNFAESILLVLEKGAKENGAYGVLQLLANWTKVRDDEFTSTAPVPMPLPASPPTPTFGGGGGMGKDGFTVSSASPEWVKQGIEAARRLRTAVEGKAAKSEKLSPEDALVVAIAATIEAAYQSSNRFYEAAFGGNSEPPQTAADRLDNASRALVELLDREETAIALLSQLNDPSFDRRREDVEQALRNFRVNGSFLRGSLRSFIVNVVESRMATVFDATALLRQQYIPAWMSAGSGEKGKQ